MEVKREHSAKSDNAIIDLTDNTPKRQRREDRASKSAITSLKAASIDIPKDLLQAYQQLLPNSSNGIIFLFGCAFAKALQVPAERAALSYGASKEQAIEELRRLLAIKVFMADQETTKISPTPLMDELWHAAILDTKFYASLQAALGVTLHHRPSGASEEESPLREKRLSVMKANHTAFFSTSPLERAPPQPNPLRINEGFKRKIHVFVRGSKEKTSFIFNMNMPRSRIWEAFCESQGVAMKTTRMFYLGARVDPNWTPDYLEMDDGDQFEVFEEIMGC